MTARIFSLKNLHYMCTPPFFAPCLGTTLWRKQLWGRLLGAYCISGSFGVHTFYYFKGLIHKMRIPDKTRPNHSPRFHGWQRGVEGQGCFSIWSHRIAAAPGFQDYLLQVLEEKICLSETTSQTRARNIENKKEKNKEKTSLTGTGWDLMHLLHSPIWLKLHNSIILILLWWKLSSREIKLWLVKDILCLTWGLHSSVYIWRQGLLTLLLRSSCTCFVFFYQLLNLDTILDQINAKA